MTLKLKGETCSLTQPSVPAQGHYLYPLSPHPAQPSLAPCWCRPAFIFAFAQLQAAALDFLGLGLAARGAKLGQHAV